MHSGKYMFLFGSGERVKWMESSANKDRRGATEEQVWRDEQGMMLSM